MENFDLTTLLNTSDISLLNKNTETKELTFLGTYESQQFILKIRFLVPTCFDSSFFSQITSAEKAFENDCYSKYLAKLSDNPLELELIYPANERQIAKFRPSEYAIVTETAEIYYEKVKPFIDAIPESDIKWVQNIVSGQKEEIIFETEQYVLLKDYKMLVPGEERFYYLSLLKEWSVKSIRDLNESHLPLLEELYLPTIKKVAELTGVAENKISCFVHYYPSFFWFHVHYCKTGEFTDSTGINRSIDLGTLIENIRMKTDYYQNVTLFPSVKIGTSFSKLLINLC